MGVLGEIIANKRAELAELRARRLPAAPASRPTDLARPPGSPLRLIAEIKRRSPSAGPLSTRLGVAERARAYELGGAAMVSVLCDRRYFDGDYEHLAEARRATNLPILCKEFVIDEIQLDAARSYGADAVLLIVRCLDQGSLGRLIEAARVRDLLPLVEVHGIEEVDRALDAGARVIGVNARDLDTLKMDLDTARTIVEGLPDGLVSIHLSGLSAPDAVRAVARGRAHAALLGEALMRQDDPLELLRGLVDAAAAEPS